MTIEITFGFGKKQFGETKNLLRISNRYLDNIDSLP